MQELKTEHMLTNLNALKHPHYSFWRNTQKEHSEAIKILPNSWMTEKKEDILIDYWTNWWTSGPISLLLDEDDDDSIYRMGILKCVTQIIGYILCQCYLVSQAIQHIRIDAHKQQQ